MSDFAYDQQTRRYLLQFMRVFSSFKIKTGPDANGLYTISRVPIVYGNPSSLVAQIIKGGSENTMLPTPMFSAYIDSIKMSPDRRRDTQFVDKVTAVEREYNTVTKQYGTSPGMRYDVERYMPVPYDFIFKLDCWTSNTTTKLQLFEQISSLFNPSIQLQQNDSSFDWTSIFEIYMEDNTFNNVSIPQGSEIQRDIMSWKFRIPGWINPPAKVKRSTIISEIITNVFAIPEVDVISQSIDSPNSVLATMFSAIPVQIITTAGNYKISIQRANNRDEITLLDPATGLTANWANLIQLYGQITPNISKLRLKLDPNIEVDTSDIIGNIEHDATRPDVLIFTPDVDTLPGNTILPIADIIDPIELTPGNGLPTAATGQRYLLTSASNDAGEEPIIPPGVTGSPWGSNIVAFPNDIIEYNAGQWSVIFSAKDAINNCYVMNNSNSTQYMYDGTNWNYSYYGQYAPGYWKLENILAVKS